MAKKKRTCRTCGAEIRSASGCTNSRCLACHDKHCTPGGSTSPGHGLGSEPDLVCCSHCESTNGAWYTVAAPGCGKAWACDHCGRHSHSTVRELTIADVI